MEKQKRVAAIHDLSGYGRCALTVILPVISAMGIQCVTVPTAILSTHTGGFSDLVLRDTTDFISPCCKHYKELQVHFDAIYSGFLASEEQADCCLEFFESFPSAVKIVDPVMGDDGTPYQTYTKGLIERTKELIAHADIITPNLTEAAILLEEDYPAFLTESQLRDWTERLCRKAKAAVITGVPLEKGGFVNASLDYDGEFRVYNWDRIPVSYPGTGDIFASAFTGAWMQDRPMEEAVRIAADFTCASICNTIQKPAHWYGVKFETALPELIRMINR